MEQKLYALPKGWEWKKLSSLAELSRKSIQPLKGRSYNYIGLEHIESGTGKLIDFSATDGGNILSTKIEFSKEMVLYGKLRPYLNKVYVAEMDGVATTEILPFKCADNLFPDFLATFMRSEHFIKAVTSNCSGARMPRATTKFFKNIAYVPLPPLNEQKRIVARLDALFTRIDTAISHLQETLELSKALFASALDEEFSNLGTRRMISDIAYVKGGKRLPKEKKLRDEPTNHPYIRVADFTDNGSIEITNLKYITEEVFEKISRYTINHGDLYISIAGTIGKTGIIPKQIDGANLTENAAKLVFKEPDCIAVRYVYYFTLSQDFIEQAGIATKVVAQPKLALARLSKIQIPIPTIEKQQKVIAHLDVLSEHTRALEAATEKRIKNLTALKASLLDQAFRGKL